MLCVHFVSARELIDARHRMENLFHRKWSERALPPVCSCQAMLPQEQLLAAFAGAAAPINSWYRHVSSFYLVSGKQHAFWFHCMVKHTMFITSVCQQIFWPSVHLLFSLTWFTIGFYFLELIWQKNQISSSSEAGHLQRPASSVELLSLTHKNYDCLLNLYHEDFFFLGNSSQQKSDEKYKAAQACPFKKFVSLV